MQQEGFQNRVWIALVQVIAGHLDEPGFFEKTRVDGARRVGRGVQALFDVEQQDLAELRYGLGCPVIAAHQGFAGAQG
ncbi:MAG: hypothetical protein ACD_23C00356G0003 [uncultured bacterium]|nr:MAG: hypothetical protein ACD_23C00356G0003 [uncultured bacterium]